jgi:aminoglycoside 3-N-acetyltransferase
MLDAKDVEIALKEELGVGKSLDLIAHVNMPAIGQVRGEASAVAAAILAAGGTVLMPAFTYQTMIIPQVGPADNGLEYGTGDELNARAEIFRPDLPVHPDCGSVAEALRRDAETLRSTHPILSFVAQGPYARQYLSAQTRQNPLAPVALLEARGGAVLLMGVDQRHNFSLHLAAQRAGRRMFLRWALTPNDIEELPNIPGAMDRFNDIWEDLAGMTKVMKLGYARCELIPLEPMLALAERIMRAHPEKMVYPV